MLLKELDISSRIGLIERRKQGHGKPTRVYSKKFTLLSDSNAGEADPLLQQISPLKFRSLKIEVILLR